MHEGRQFKLQQVVAGAGTFEPQLAPSAGRPAVAVLIPGPTEAEIIGIAAIPAETEA